MQKKIRVGAVSYLNTKPLIYGFEHGQMADQIDLILDYPSNLASKMLTDQLDIALLPVASIPHIEEASVFSRYCISSDDEVASVCLFSEVPIDEIQEVYLDYQSRTSVALLRMLLRDFWKVRPMLLEADTNYIQRIKDKRAGIVIGDRALEVYSNYPFRYDLSAAWHSHTQLPFVFATWVTNKELSTSFIKSFDDSNAIGLNHIDEIVSACELNSYDLKTYFTQNIQYELTEERRNGMQLFLKSLELL